jgi:hypothetical protein
VRAVAAGVDYVGYRPAGHEADAIGHFVERDAHRETLRETNPAERRFSPMRRTTALSPTGMSGSFVSSK